MSSSLTSPVASTTTGSIFSIPNNVIYLVEIIVYSLLVIFSTVILFKAGRKNAQGWISLGLFGVLKIVGSAMLLSVAVTEHNNKAPSVGIITAGLVLSSIALGPLENAGLAFINQGAEHWHKTSSLSPGSLTSRSNRIIKLVILLAAILSMVGNIQMTSNSSNKSTAKTLIKVGSILFGLAFVAITSLAIYCVFQIGKRYSPSYRAYVFGVLFASPFFLVRIIFSIVSAFTIGDDILQYRTFSSFNGNWKVRLVMMILMEFIISIIYCVCGYNAELKKREESVDLPNDRESEQHWVKGPGE